MPGEWKSVEAECTCTGCDRREYAHGLCNAHYMRRHRQGPDFDQSPIGHAAALARTLDGKHALPDDGVKRCKFARVLRLLREDNPGQFDLVVDALTNQHGDRKGALKVAEALKKTDRDRYGVGDTTIYTHLWGRCLCDEGADELHDFGTPGKSGQYT